MQIFDGRLWIWLLRFLIVISIPLFLLLIIWGWFSSKDKLDKDYAEFKSKNKIAASKEFEKDLAAEADLTKIRPPKPTQADRVRIIKAKQIKQRLARIYES